MQLRGRNNSTSVTGIVVGFGLLTCVVGVGAIVADFEPYVVRFGILAYMVVVAPVLLAALCGAMGSESSKTFRLTRPAYMRGLRVKRRLWWLSIAGTAISIAALIGGFVGGVWAVTSVQFLSAEHGLSSVVLCVLPIVAYYVGGGAFAVACVALNWMSRKEAGEFLTPKHRWPETWLEPMGEEK